MRLRSPRPESLLAWAAAAVGAIGVVSALTPGFAHRFQIVDGGKRADLGAAALRQSEQALAAEPTPELVDIVDATPSEPSAQARREKRRQRRRSRPHGRAR
ncbi:MAG: hypothetical protein ACHQCG_07485 [Solirubrobacterales bacterium]